MGRRVTRFWENTHEGGLHPTRIRDSSQPEAVIGY